MNYYKKIVLWFGGYLSLLLFISLPAHADTGTTVSFYQRLNSLEGVEVVDVAPVDGYTQGYALLVKQPLDHTNPDAGWFKQRVYLGHLDVLQPVVIETDGYSINDYPDKELPGVVRGNLVAVEYRFYGESKTNGEGSLGISDGGAGGCGPSSDH
jgi:hypothetical protein